MGSRCLEAWASSSIERAVPQRDSWHCPIGAADCSSGVQFLRQPSASCCTSSLRGGGQSRGFVCDPSPVGSLRRLSGPYLGLAASGSAELSASAPSRRGMRQFQRLTGLTGPPASDNDLQDLRPGVVASLPGDRAEGERRPGPGGAAGPARVFERSRRVATWWLKITVARLRALWASQFHAR